ncbi:hypothetical protein [Kaistella antarctica]|uniref:Uncharacterized protein n=1 Tax=Kaistella antarctica TaxID=266748 RepID=A0A448NV11_9FLAO|nr:hypothetical protein [Kaistella antarctica]KEY20334.1 hypothetical protein HY04_03795 [Kaistella antarctica]SEV90864.1 hypothetical protein SAMN05421765_1011 [Kaistella antarctica]VEI01540.1 Uncharacterised protein [Kaistella antarctica]
MKKQIVQWLFTKILLPFLKDILAQILKGLSKYVIQYIRDLLEKWKTKEMKVANTEEEKEIIKNKWDERKVDLDKMNDSVDEHIDIIMKEAMANSEKRVAELQDKSSDDNIMELVDKSSNKNLPESSESK